MKEAAAHVLAHGKPKKEKSKGEGKKKVHHMEIHKSESGGHVAVHKHHPPHDMPQDDTMHTVPEGGMDEHLAANMGGQGEPDEGEGPESAGQEMAEKE